LVLQIIKIFSVISLLFSSGCLFKSQEGTLLQILENKYANLVVGEPRKRKVIKEIKELIAAKKTLKNNFESYEKVIKKMGDAHLSLEPVPTPKTFYSNLKLEIENSVWIIRENQDRKRLVKIDGVDYAEWASKNSQRVFASSFHGRRYRTLKLLEGHHFKDLIINQVELEDGEIIDLKWSSTKKETSCISGKAHDEKNFILKVSSFWCDEGKSKRKEIFENFKKRLDETLEVSKGHKNIILDLRDNGGGGDDEVRYLLSKLISKKAFLYTYQFVGKKKITDYIEPAKDSIGHKNITVLINGGCFSACEVVTSVLKLSEARAIIGERTHGGAGDPLYQEFETSKLIYPSCVVWQEDGSLYEGIGVAPTIEGDGESLKKAFLLSSQ